MSGQAGAREGVRGRRCPRRRQVKLCPYFPDAKAGGWAIRRAV